ncbi:hypothetical protein QR680_001648 [Steinernema hermaphroditum]|uniref:G-protein coupled receptors family 1 profile domain-containing protein n=1 Tax=Steinernema hermaphroditum TaxID=289476 RepID=A0AA39H002_9BILA|nr:hypothetical protein QR680_001648 [Steinernema hermaphroditum]
MEITSSDPCDRLIYANATITSYVHSILGDRCAPKSAAIPSVAMYSILLILGLFGNACTIIVIMKNKSMHTPTNFYLMSLATSDVLMLLLGLPMELYDAINVIYPYPFSEDICKLRAFLTEFTSYASVLTILCFSVERWLAICFPLKSKSFSSFGRAGMIIFCVWMISFIAALPMAFLVVLNRVPLPDFAMNQPWTYLVTDDGLTIRGTDLCGMDFLKQAEQNIIIYFAFIVFFLLPALLITSAYCHIFIRLKNIDSCFGKSVRLVQVTDKQERTRRSVLKVLVAVVVSFFLCWFPFHLQRLLSINMTESNSSPAMHNIFISLFYLSGFCYYSNSASNPILYNIFSGRYRSAFCHTILGERITAKYVASASFVERGVNQRLAGSKIPLIQRAKTERNFGSNTFPPVKSSSFQGVVYSARGKDKRHKNSLTDLTLQVQVLREHH